MVIDEKCSIPTHLKWLIIDGQYCNVKHIRHPILWIWLLSLESAGHLHVNPVLERIPERVRVVVLVHQFSLFDVSLNESCLGCYVLPVKLQFSVHRKLWYHKVNLKANPGKKLGMNWSNLSQDFLKERKYYLPQIVYFGFNRLQTAWHDPHFHEQNPPSTLIAQLRN